MPKRPHSFRVHVRALFVRLFRLKPVQLVVAGYFTNALVCWALLALPWAQKEPAPWYDSLFTAASAVSTTGLITVSTPDAWTPFGLIVIIFMIQINGIGYMTLGSYIVMGGFRTLTKKREEIARVSYALPGSLGMRSFLKQVLGFTLAIEAVGTIALAFLFEARGVDNPWWHAAFHSISAFCTAGFSTFSDSFQQFRDSSAILLVIAFVALSGAIGFIVMSDAWQWVRNRAKPTFTTKIIFLFTFGIMILGWAGLIVLDPGLRDLPLEDRAVTAFFHSMSAMTTVGFNTYPIGEILPSAMMVVIALMLIGASPAGTGGGLKTTTVSATLAAVRSIFRGYKHSVFHGRRIPADRMMQAHASVGFYLAFLLVGLIAVMAVDSNPVGDQIFEVSSAISTAGLSRGITPDLSPAARVILSLLMLIGRIGPLTFGLAIFAHDPEEAPPDQSEELIIA